jgi:hypothetical protein
VQWAKWGLVEWARRFVELSDELEVVHGEIRKAVLNGGGVEARPFASGPIARRPAEMAQSTRSGPARQSGIVFPVWPLCAVCREGVESSSLGEEPLRSSSRHRGIDIRPALSARSNRRGQAILAWLDATEACRLRMWDAPER